MAIAVQVLMVLASLILIVSVLLQPSESNGMGAVTGSSETFFGKNKGGSFEGKMAMITKVSAGVFVLLALIMMFIK